jgi:hypothetical protein
MKGEEEQENKCYWKGKKNNSCYHIIHAGIVDIIHIHIYSILISISFIVGFLLCYIMEQIEVCCGHRIESPVFSIETPLKTVLRSTSAFYAPYSRRLSVFVPNI